MIEEINKLIDRYSAWLADKTTLRQIKDWVEITTPYLDRHNDYLQIYVKRHNGGYLLTDDGYIITDLNQSGCVLETKKRKDLLHMTLNGFGVREQGNALTIEATANNFPLKKHNLVQAMMAVNDLFYLAIPIVASVFLEDVTAWLDLNDIRYINNVKFTGSSGYDHMFDFVIPKSKKYPDRYMRAINRPSRETVESFAMAWVDTKGVRAESVAYAILNDFESDFSTTIASALLSFDIAPIPWSHRESYLEQLAS